MNTSQVPFIGTALPGPKAQAMLDRERVWVSQNYVKDYPLVVDKAEGMVLTDLDGNRFLDFAAGIAVCATGHCHPSRALSIACVSGCKTQRAPRCAAPLSTARPPVPTACWPPRACRRAPAPRTPSVRP